MEFFLGVLVTALFFGALLLAYRAGKKVRPAQRTKDVPDEEAKRQAKDMREHFQQLMNYDTKTALKRKEAISSE